MPSDSNTMTIHASATQEMLNLPKLYGPNGFLKVLNDEAGGPPAALVAALEQLETATVDPTLLTGGQTVDSVEAQTIADLGSLAQITLIELGGAASAGTSVLNGFLSSTSYRYPSVAASLEADAKLFTPADAKPPVTVVDPPPPSASGVEQFLVTNTATGVSDWENGQAYNGPVAGLQNQFITVTADNVNITATKPNSFIHTGPGNDAIDVSLFQGDGGTNVVDGAAGSNFIKVNEFNSATTVFIDNRAATADTWSTVLDFHKGDAVTIYGVTPSATALDWEDGQGAGNLTGLTLHAIEQGKPIASLTLVGGRYGAYTKADLSNGRLSVSFGDDSASGDGYLHIQGTAY